MASPKKAKSASEQRTTRDRAGKDIMISSLTVFVLKTPLNIGKREGEIKSAKAGAIDKFCISGCSAGYNAAGRPGLEEPKSPAVVVFLS